MAPADTRPFLQGENAILRTMLVIRHKQLAPQPLVALSSLSLSCLWVSGVGGMQHEAGHSQSPLTLLQYGYLRDNANHEYLGSCKTNVSEATLRAGGGVPRFVTITSRWAGWVGGWWGT